MSDVPPFDRVLADYLPMIRRIAAAYEADASAREDLVQDVLYAVWRALPRYRGDGGLRAFIARVATNRGGTAHVARGPGPDAPALRAPEPGLSP